MTSMTHRTSGPQLGLGCNTLGSVRAGGMLKSVRTVQHALAHGITLFDTADAYGDGSSERVLGKAIAGRRDSVVIATKAGYRFRERGALKSALRQLAGPVIARVRSRAKLAGTPLAPHAAPPAAGAYAEQDFSTGYLTTALEQSLRRLRTDHVDVFQLHGPKSVCSSDLPVCMQDLIRAGKMRGFGVGLESLTHAMEWLAVDGLTHIQIPFGVLDPEAGRALIEMARRRGVAVIARGIFAAGLLADLSPDAERLLDPLQREHRRAIRDIAAGAGMHALALAAWYVRSTAGVSSVLFGLSTIAHLDDTLKHLSMTSVSDDVRDRVKTAVDAYLEALAARGSR